MSRVDSLVWCLLFDVSSWRGRRPGTKAGTPWRSACSAWGSAPGGEATGPPRGRPLQEQRPTAPRARLSCTWSCPLRNCAGTSPPDPYLSESMTPFLRCLGGNPGSLSLFSQSLHAPKARACFWGLARWARVVGACFGRRLLRASGFGLYIVYVLCIYIYIYIYTHNT